MLRIFNIVNRKKREFGYKPRYYDADKDQFQKHVERRVKGNNKGYVTKSNIRKQFTQHKNQKASAKNFLRSGGFYRLITIIIVLLLVSYVVLNTFLPRFMQSLFPEEYKQYEVLDRYEAFEK